MILKTYMSRQGDDDTIFVGSKSGYFFIGNKNKFKEDIQGINEKYINTCTGTLESSKHRLEWLTQTGEPKEVKIVEYMDENCHIVRETIPVEILVERYWKQMEKTKTTIAECERYLNNFTPLETRKVIEINDNKILCDGKICLVVGEEIGKYWLKEEYETSVVEESSEVFDE